VTRSWVLLGAVVALTALPATANATLATTAVPYMGWNTYYGVGGNFDESTIKSVANTLKSTGLEQAGYNIVWLDFGWASGARDPSTHELTVDSTLWPDGMSGLTSWLHTNGFKAGIYTDAGNSGCSNSGVGSYGYYQLDADQFAAWGFDAIKVDFCGAGQQWLDASPNDPRTLYGEFSSAVANTGVPMILNVDNFWTPGQINGSAPSFADSSWDDYSWAPSVAQSWRTDTDIGYGGGGGIPWWAVLRNLSHDTGTDPKNPQPGIANAAGPPGSIAWGHWNDPDYLGPGLGMTNAQAQSQFSMWAMVAAPLILGSDPRQLGSSQIKMLENSRVIAIDKDSLGAQGYLLKSSGSGQVWVKPLAGGDRAVALFNQGSGSLQISTTASAIGLPPDSKGYKLTNLWTNKTTTTSGSISASVGTDTVVLYRVSPA
jgi:alpha-galactosidase